MHVADQPQQRERRHNGLGFLRLAFASMVIAAHVPEIVDVSDDRELLYSLTANATLSTLALPGFFIISGFLISQSFQASPGIGAYLLKRAARIYPALIVASLLCMLVVAPLAGADLGQLTLHNVVAGVARAAILSRPVIYGAFPGQHYNDPHSALDGPIWTIQYEFACYLLVIVLGSQGLLRRPAVLATASVVCLIASLAMPAGRFGWLSHPDLFAGVPGMGVLLLGMFLAGATFASVQERVPVSRGGVVAAAAILIASLFSHVLTPFGLAICGTYLIFAFAQAAGDTAFGRINNRNDISYGVYLYGWPAEQLLIRYMGSGSLVLLGVLTWAIAAVLGTASWFLVERPALAFAKRWR